MKVYSLLLLSFFAIISHLQAQMFEVEKGYVITSKGDTINGQVRFISSYLINFKEEKTGKKYALNPKQYVAAINGKNEYYQSLTVTIDGVSQDVFMQYLMDGDVAFYQFTDETNENTFYIKKQGGENLRKLNKLNYNFIRKTYLINCDSVYNGKKIGESDFRRNIVEYQISTHNQRCSPVSNPFSIKYNDKKRSVKFGINVGYNASILHSIAESPFLASRDANFRIEETNEITSGFFFGGTLFFPYSKNIIVAPELNYILREQFTVQSSNIFSGLEREALINRNSSIPYKDFKYGGYFSTLFSINMIEFTPLNLIVRTNKYKYNPSFGVGAPFRYYLSKSANDFDLGLSISFGVDFKLYKNIYSKIYFKYIKNRMLRDEGTDKLINSWYEFMEQNIQIGYTIIF